MTSGNDDSNSMASTANEPGSTENAGEVLSDEQKRYAAQFLTTEHFTLQSARSATISDSAGRAGLFMSTVSTSLIALAFVGQMSQAGEAFNVFALVLFPTLFFLGLVTFKRVLQSALADRLYDAGISRIRHFYIEIVPQTSKYFILGTNDDSASTLGGERISKWQWFLTTAGTIMVINSVLLGVLTAFVIRALIDAPLEWLVVGGLLTCGVSLTLHYVYQAEQWSSARKRMPVIFPSDQEKSKS